MMRSDEIPAAPPDFTSLGFVHLRNGGHSPIGRAQR